MLCHPLRCKVFMCDVLVNMEAAQCSVYAGPPRSQSHNSKTARRGHARGSGEASGMWTMLDRFCGSMERERVTERRGYLPSTLAAMNVLKLRGRGVSICGTLADDQRARGDSYCLVYCPLG